MPTIAIGTIGAPVRNARRTAPVRARSGQWPGSRVVRPSGKMPTASPAARAWAAGSRASAADDDRRCTGMNPTARASRPTTGMRNTPAVANSRTERPMRRHTRANRMPST